MKNLRVAAAAFYSCAAILMLIGLVYLLRSGPMPYHLEFLGKKQEELSAQMVAMLIFAKGAIGSLLVSIAIAVAMLTYQLKRQGWPWLRWTLLLSMLPSLLMFLRITLAVGTHSPWWAVAALTALVFVGFWAAAPAAGGQK